MIKIRNGVFETNSSSCHTITICGQKMLDLYRAGKVVCVTDFSYSDDGDTYQNVIPDSCFWTFKKLLDYIEPRFDGVCIPAYYINEYNTLRGSIDTIEHFREALKDYDVKYLVQHYFLDDRHLFMEATQEPEFDPFRGYDISFAKYDDIEGSIATIHSEISC